MSPSTNTSSCECQFSIPSGEKSLHSVDPANSELSYISAPDPVDTSLFAPIRIACIRSLNSETYCGREGSVFFGDGKNGYVLSYMFTVYDAQSRGHRVKYTIMTMMTDRVYLVASMEYLISQFQIIASNLQSMANALCPQVQSPAPRSMSFSSSSRRGTIIPEKRHIHGRPNNECTLLERNQAWEAGAYGDGEGEAQTIESLRELRRVLGRQRFNRLIWNSLVGNQVIIRGEESRIVREVIKSLEADWSTTTLVADMKELSTVLEKIPGDVKGPNGQLTADSSLRPPHSSPGVLYSPGGGFQAQRRQYLLQAGEEPPEALDMLDTEMPIKDSQAGQGQGQGQGGRMSPSHKQSHPLYIETVNDILDFKMPRLIEAKRLAVLREEWISKARQFHNLYKSGFTSDETVVHRFLQSMGVDQRDLKILRFFTRCARSTSLQSQKIV
ncbi:hypothetical protein BGX29_009995 [Mortierella sp. GBA35]|nr:hypothetical protein BGX29_009995 [Mortierella sp. GBA35]